jgi:hypothetical protein
VTTAKTIENKARNDVSCGSQSLVIGTTGACTLYWDWNGGRWHTVFPVGSRQVMEKTHRVESCRQNGGEITLYKKIREMQAGWRRDNAKALGTSLVWWGRGCRAPEDGTNVAHHVEQPDGRGKPNCPHCGSSTHPGAVKYAVSTEPKNRRVATHGIGL